FTPAAITVTAATDSRGYNGTTASAGVPTVTVGTIFMGDTGTFTQSYDTKHVGTGKTLTPAGSVSDGNSGLNYAVTFANNTTGVITQAAITVTAATDSRGYNGTTASAGVPTVTVGTIFMGDTGTFTQSYDTKHVGTGKTLTPAGSVSDGNSGLNYAVTFANNTTGVITQAAITVTAATDSRGYNGTTASAGVPTVTVGTIFMGDTGTFTQSYDTKHVGTGKTLTPAGSVSDGNSGLNYAVTFANNTTGVITQAAITVTAATDSRGYNGTTASAGVPTVTVGTIFMGDTGTFTQSYDTKHVGTGKTLTPAGSVSDGNSGLNYAVTFANNTTGVITQAAITVTAATDSRGYNGTTASAGVPTVTVGTIFMGDTGTFTQSYDTKHVGTGKTLTPAGSVSDGNSGLNYAVTFANNTTGVITQAAITVTAATDSRGYNGTTASAGVPTVTVGTIFMGDTGTFTQSYDTKHVGTGKTLTPAGSVSDGNSGLNYAVTFANNTTGVITQAAITVTAATDSRGYNGTTASAGVPTVTVGTIFMGDTGTFTQSYDTKHVGTGKTLTPAGSVSDGNSGLNYAVTFANNTTGVITPAAITVTAATDSRGYNGTTASAGVPTVTVGTIFMGDTGTFTQSYDTKHVGTGKTLTPAGSVSDGNSGLNYAVTFANNTTGVITPAAITVTAATDSRGYNGTTASAGVPTVTVGTIFMGDTGTFTQSYDTKHVGTGKTLTPAGSVSDGNSGLNYAVTFANNTTGVITPAAITVTAATDSRGYNGTTASAGVPTVTVGTIFMGDTGTFTQSYDTKHVGTGKTLTPAGSVSDGNSGLNYAVTFANNTTGVITQAAITVTAATDSRGYNGTTASAGVPTVTVGTIFMGDTGTFTQSYDTKHVGTGKTLTPAGSVSDGN